MEPTSNEDRLVLAAQAIDHDPDLSVRAAAKAYSVPHTTLTTRLRGTASRRDSTPKSRNLTDAEELAIVRHALDMDARLFPPRLSNVEDMANKLLADRKAPPVGKRWASNFVKRQPQLKTRFLRRYDHNRAQCEDPEVVSNWFVLVQNTIAKYGILDADVHNFDEAGFMMGAISTGMIVTSANKRSSARMVQPGNREWVTLIQGVNSQGWTIPPFIIVAAQYHLITWYKSSPLPNDWVIATTDKGWTTNDTAVAWTKHFDKYTRPRTIGRYRLLGLDGHGSHHSTPFELYCKENEIITLCMPPHSSHILQPLDVGCFGPLKKSYGRLIEEKVRAGVTHVAKEDFLSAFSAAFQDSLTEKNVQGGFRGTGLVPLDPTKVMTRLNVAPRTPTPVERGSETPAPWDPRTPKNATEATSQSRFIKDRIARHQNSSPTSALDAVDQIVKGTQGVMHKMVLLKSENHILRGEVEALSRRRRTKKTRLQKGGSLSLAAARDLQVRNDAEVEIREEKRRSSGRKPRVEARRRHCGACGKPGHNARTCQSNAQGS